jgi:osmotically-inducible protein OsmY
MDEKTRLPQTTDPSQVAEDTRIVKEVARTLAASGRFPSGRVEVSTSEGIVKLRGRVGSYYQKQVAQVAASTVIEPRRLVNEIEVG